MLEELAVNQLLRYCFVRGHVLEILHSEELQTIDLSKPLLVVFSLHNKLFRVSQLLEHLQEVRSSHSGSEK